MTIHFVVVQFVKHSAVDHLLLPADGDGACAELLEELLILALELDGGLDLGGVPELVRVLGVDHVGFWHPGRLHQPGLQTTEIDGLEKRVGPWVIPATIKKDTRDI